MQRKVTIFLIDREKAQKFYLLSVDCLDRGCDSDALSYLYQSFELQEHPKTAQLISQILYQREQNTAAFQFLEKAYSLGSNNHSIAFCYAEQLIQQGRTDQANCILQDILKRNHSYKKARVLLEKQSSGCASLLEDNSKDESVP